MSGLLCRGPDSAGKLACWPAGKKFAFVLTHDVETELVGQCRPYAIGDGAWIFVPPLILSPKELRVPASYGRSSPTANLK